MFRRTPSRGGVAGLLWISWCVLGAAGFRFSSVFLFERTRPAASMRSPCLIYLSTSDEGRPRERSDGGRFLPIRQKKPLHTGVRTGCHYLVCLPVRLRVCVCVTLVVFTDCESCTRLIYTNPGSTVAAR